jgi:hypothetical protein
VPDGEPERREPALSPVVAGGPAGAAGREQGSDGRDKLLRGRLAVRRADLGLSRTAAVVVQSVAHTGGTP